MSAIPAVLDALVAVLRVAPGLAGGSVFDGPQVDYAGTVGVAVGATREDLSTEFVMSSAGPGSTAEQVTVSCLAWSGSGDTVFKPHRDRTGQILDAVESALTADRSLGGVVSTAWITGGSLTQEQTGRGALVTLEFRVTADVF